MDSEDGRARGAGREVRNELSGGTFLGPVVQAGHIQQFNVYARPPLGVIPRQLRAPVARFVNRADELAALDTAATTGAAVVLLWGPGGVGKSSLAVQWLHANTDRFPDGQLCVDLAGAVGTPVTAGEALGILLRSLDVAPEVLPASVEERTGLFRSLTHDRRMSVLVENAATAAQVRPLLPASAGSMVIVTSRASLAALRVGTELDVVEVRPLPDGAAVDLLRITVGASRAEREPHAMRRLVSMCGGLPLAVAVVGARLAARPRTLMAAAVDELADERRRLARMAIADEISVQAVFDVSYQELPPPVAGLYRALGLHPGPEFSVAVAAAAAGVGESQVGEWLSALAEQSLVTELEFGRYRFHNLFWLHAADRAAAEDSESTRAAVAGRIVDWYLTRAVAADLVVTPRRWRVGPVYSRVGDLADRAAGLAWLEGERANLVAAVRLADEYRLDDAAWQLCVALWSLFFVRKYHEDWLDTHDLGVTAARRCGDRLAESKVRSQRGFALLELGRIGDATEDFERALTAAQEAGNAQARSTALESLGLAGLADGRYADALARFDQALEVAETLGDERALGLLAHHRGRALGGLGRHTEALAALDTALAAMREVGDEYNTARVLTSIGSVYLRTGQIERADEHLTAALETMRQRSAYQAAQVAILLADVAHLRGAVDDERVWLKEALEHFGSLHAPQVAEVGQRLAALADPGSV